jgi:hypothetical protein
MEKDSIKKIREYIAKQEKIIETSKKNIAQRKKLLENLIRLKMYSDVALEVYQNNQKNSLELDLAYTKLTEASKYVQTFKNGPYWKYAPMIISKIEGLQGSMEKRRMKEETYKNIENSTIYKLVEEFYQESEEELKKTA